MGSGDFLKEPFSGGVTRAKKGLGQGTTERYFLKSLGVKTFGPQDWGAIFLRVKRGVAPNILEGEAL